MAQAGGNVQVATAGRRRAEAGGGDGDRIFSVVAQHADIVQFSGFTAALVRSYRQSNPAGLTSRPADHLPSGSSRHGLASLLLCRGC
jgi:hypothetical protein